VQGSIFSRAPGIGSYLGWPSSAESHDRAGRIETACHAGLADLACIRPSINNSHVHGGRNPTVLRAACLTGTGRVHLHSPIGTRCGHDGGAAGLDDLA
jgi:hypothetical protein